MAYLALPSRDCTFLLVANAAPRLPRSSGVTVSSPCPLVDASPVRPLRVHGPRLFGATLLSKPKARGPRIFASVEGNVTVEEPAVSAGSEESAAGEEKAAEATATSAAPAKILGRSNTLQRQAGGPKREITVTKEQLVPGAVFTGKVRAVQSYGAFVDIGAFTDGLVHISQLSSNYVREVNDVVSLGQEVSVTVIEVNDKAGRIALTMRDKESEAEQQASRSGGESGAGPGSLEEGSGKPRNQGKIAGRGAKANSRSSDDNKATKLKKGQELKGTVKNIIRNGAFIAFAEEGEEGFLRGSEITEGGENVAVDTLLTVGQEVTVRVLKIERGKAALTMKPQVDVSSINDSINTNVGAGGASNPFATFFRNAKMVPETPASVETPAAEELSAVQEAAAVEERTSAFIESPALEDKPAVDETSAVDEAPAVEETAAIEETPAVEGTAAVAEVPTVEESAAVTETPVLEEIAAVEETPAAEETAAVAETSAVGETAVIAGAPSVEESAAVEEIPASEETAALAETPSVEETAAVEETPAAGETAAVADILAVEGTASAVETPAVEETAAVKETPAAEETAAVVEAPAVEETGAVEEIPASEETAAVAETPAVEETAAVEEIPASEETAAVAETPAVGETAAVEETPAAGETAAVAETSAVEGTAATDEVPAVEQTAAVGETPAAQEIASVAETPLVGESPAVAEVPATDESPAVEETPATEAAQTEAPAAEENGSESPEAEEPRSLSLGEIAEGIGSAAQEVEKVAEAAADLLNIGDKDGAASDEGAEASAASSAEEETQTIEASGEAPAEVTQATEVVSGPVAGLPAVEEPIAAAAEEPKGAGAASGPTAAQVKELREKSGAGMMECKKALVACGNDMEKASEYLRKKGLASAEKRASRIAAEGRVGSYVHDGRIGVLIELNCETDFVSRGTQFKELVADMGMQVVACPDVKYVSVDDVPGDFVAKEREIEMGKEDLASKPPQIREKIVEGRIAKRLAELALLEQAYIRDDKVLVKDHVKAAAAKLGENIQVRRFVRFNLGEGLQKKSVDFAAEVAAQTAAKADVKPAGEAPKAEKGGEGPKVAVSAASVKQLREATGAGMMDCKKALAACGGDVEKATEYLRKKGLASADKKSGRIASEGRIGSYIHDGRIGVLVEVNSETDFVARSGEFKELVANIGMQVAACPQVEYVKVDEIPASFVEKEKEIEAGKEDLAKRPDAIREKIVEGRVAKTLNELALLEQPYIRDDKILVRDYVKQTIAALGENIQVRRFVRFNLGEGIEKRSTDFAAEVAAQTGAKA